jgi:hypothetical protein
MKAIKKAQVGDTIKKPSVRRTTTKNYDVTETTYPGGDKETVTKFNPRGGAKFTVPSLKSSKKKNKMKDGGSVKAKDGMWMQKAAASIKRRGTAGKCTPITKPGCTGKAKALAKTFKKIAKSNKKK